MPPIDNPLKLWFYPILISTFWFSGILTDVKETYKINNAEAGLLQTAFVASFMIFAPLFGYLGDRYNRKWVMVVGITVWALATLLGSFMEDFGTFMLMRSIVGIGEASYTTIAPTILSDLFVKEMRSKALAIFYFAIPVGGWVLKTLKLPNLSLTVERRKMNASLKGLKRLMILNFLAWMGI